MYTVAIAINLWMLWDMVKDQPDAQILKGKVEARVRRLVHPFRAEQLFRRHANEVVYEAMTIVEAET